MLSARLVDEVGPVMTIGAAFAVSALALTPSAAQAAGPLLHPAVMATATAVAVLSAGLPYLLELVALQAVPASTFSILLSLEPAADALMGLAILGQHPRPAELVAVLPVVIASAGAEKPVNQQSPGDRGLMRHTPRPPWAGESATRTSARPGT